MITCGLLSIIRGGGSNAEADFDLVMDAEAAAGELSKKFAQGHVASAKKNGQMNFIRLSILFCRNIARPPCLVGVWHHADALP